jgi:hypothetical protein
MSTTTATFPKAIKNDNAYRFGNYTAALPEPAKDVIGLTRAEKLRNCEVLAFTAEFRHEDDETETGRFAVCRAIAREEWAKIPTGTVIAYTELYRWAVNEPTLCETDYKGIVGDYCTHLGQMARFDAKRNVFYAASWACTGDNDALDYEGDDICEVYVVERFIERYELA